MLPLHGYSSTDVPLAVRQWPSTRMVPSCTAIQFWFDLPVQVHSSIGLAVVVLAAVSSRHLLLPPCCRIRPTGPVAAAALTVQVKLAVAVAPAPSVALAVAWNVPVA